MKDRFLFKAKRIDNGEWIIGFLTFHKTGKAFIKPIFGDARSSEEVDPSTICQCTGLKDKNGNLIWENDILFLKDEINGCKWKAVVEFGNPTGEYNWGWQLVQVTECEANKDILLWIETGTSYVDVKIIGNTIDNPELLEGGE
ncbi:hypothetical protein DW019_01755 [Clostridium sp. AF37-5]|jgi:uncharacterized phage protein (TIGR01671 family)|uniref:YopX family protein n=1 Tax=Clostridium sp. AF37-5 TaxID=2293016 RepID=UPI000E5143B5|nr:YopX family protein [Clostridium sp. AF37-5]RHO99305.1 hypothetical protein DW019_01755 [Clostridium sp. AF37-5]